MAQKKYVTYDIKKNIKLELNPAFIAGLQQIYTRYITEMYNDTENFGQLIKDFNETIMDPEAAKKKNRQFTPVESELYTLYSIINILKAHAKEQGLEKLEDLDVTEEQFKQFIEESKEEGKTPTQLLGALAEKLTAATKKSS